MYQIYASKKITPTCPSDSETAWQRRRKDNIAPLPGCAEPILHIVIPTRVAEGLLRNDVHNALRAGTDRLVHTGEPRESGSPSDTGSGKPCGNAMQVATKVITS